MRRLTIAGMFFLFALVLAGRASSARAQGQPPGPVSANVLVMIVGNPLEPGDQVDGRTGRQDPAITSLIRSWPLPAGEPGESQDYTAHFEHLSVSPEGYTLGELIVMRAGRGSVEEMLSSAQQRLQEALLEVHRLRMEPLEHKVESAHVRVARAEQAIEDLVSKLQALQRTAQGAGHALEPDDPQLLTSVRRDNLALRAEVAGLNAQRQAIVEQIAEATDKLAAVKDDERLILEGLMEVLHLREHELGQLLRLQESGTVPVVEVSRAEVAVAQARADLADRRLTLAHQAGGGQLGRLNEKLVETQIAITTAEARLEETQKAIEQLERSSYNPASSLAIDYQRTRRALDNAWSEQEAAAAELARLKMARDAVVPPRVVPIRKELNPQ